MALSILLIEQTGESTDEYVESVISFLVADETRRGILRQV